jgi:predicted metalloprotease with PDZ domain
MPVRSRATALAVPLLVAVAAIASGAPARAAPPIIATPYPGTLTLQVDATDLDHRILQVRETVPVRPGPLTLYFPRWLPGHHAPNGKVGALAGLAIRGAGRPIGWTRDPLDAHAFIIDVPTGVDALELEFQSLTPNDFEAGRVVMTPEMLDLQWDTVLLYPAGHDDRRITIRPSLRLPSGWTDATALETERRDGTRLDYKAVSVETLIDSPVFAGRRLERFDLDPQAREQGRAPVFLDLLADNPADLTPTPAQLAALRALVTQADRLFGARHYAHYDLLLGLSDRLARIGLEHHQSSENVIQPGYFADWDKASVGRSQLAHEYVHSWNGKFRRPADLWTPNTNTPMQDSLLWVYEGQTQFWGIVLAARAGLVPETDTRDELAASAAAAATQPGRGWRDLQDTTNSPIIAAEQGPSEWRDWQRGRDYYYEMVLVWLDADSLIRERSGNARSLDDFARAFFGLDPGRVDPLVYTFDDVVTTLQRVEAVDWAAFLRERLRTHRDDTLLQGLQRAGWRLAWKDEPSGFAKAVAARWHVDDYSYSLGFAVDKEGSLRDVRWNGPAYRAGLAPGTKLVAVGGVAYSAERLKQAIRDAKTKPAPIELLVKNGDYYKTVAIDWHDGLRYPSLERIAGTDDRLTPLLSARP